MSEAITINQLKADVQRTSLEFFTGVGDSSATAKATAFATHVAALVQETADQGDSILKCTHTSIRAALAYLYALNLPPARGLVYLYAKNGSLTVSLTHRALILLAERAGYRLRCQTVHEGDELEITYTHDGVEYRHKRGTAPRTWETCTGAYVAIWRDGSTIPTELHEVDKSYLAKTVAKSTGAAKTWPLEMAQKSAIKSAFARGYVSFHDAKIHEALAADTDAGANAPAPTAPAARTLEDALTPSAP